MTPWEEVRSESTTLPRRANPLPGMLLVLSIALTIGVPVLGRARLGDERQRTAQALKANDDVEARLRKEAQASSDDVKAELDKRAVVLELAVQKLQAEIDETKARLAEAERRKGRR